MQNICEVGRELRFTGNVFVCGCAPTYTQRERCVCVYTYIYKERERERDREREREPFWLKSREMGDPPPVPPGA